MEKNIIKRNNVNVVGNGDKVLVFAHGFGCEQGMWRYILPAFTHDYQVVLFDYVGSGNSDVSAYDPEKYNQLEGYAQDVIDVIESLALSDVTFVGHSVSSMIGLLAANARPDLITDLIMIGPSPCYLNTTDYQGGFDEADITDMLEMMEMNFEGWASYMAPMAMEASPDEEKVRDLESTFVSNEPGFARQFAEVTFFSDYRHILPESDVKTLILQCAQDSIVPVEVGYYLKDHLKNSELFVMETKGHYPHISQPEKTIEAIRAYIA